MKKHIYFNSPVILTFTLISIGAFILNYLTNNVANSVIFSTYNFSINNLFSYYKLITHIFGHASINHLTSNMTIILLLGPLLEEKYGSKNLIKLILITALACSVINTILFNNIALLGASGICFLFIVLSSITGKDNTKIPLTLILVVIFYLGREISSMILVKDNISNLSHLIGGMIGIFEGLSINKKLVKPNNQEEEKL